MSESRRLRWQRRCGLTILFLSAALWAITTIFFIGVWDQVAAITTFPQWSWALAGSLGAITAWRFLGKGHRLPRALLILWALATLVFADNLRPVFRGLVHGTTPAKIPASGTFRIITLNCASSAAAADEVMAFNPNVVLLQESPTSSEVARLARKWFGENAAFVAGLDCAIVTRHPLKLLEERPTPQCTRAILLLPESRQLLITSLRLTPPLGRMDLWNPAAWHAYLEDRRLRKRQLQSVLDAHVASANPELPEIMGGDFNAPAGDGIYKLLTQFRDAHRVAGRGWGNTALNTLPFFRPDEIWLKRLTAVSSSAVRTVHSDHRLVIADVMLDSKDR